MASSSSSHGSKDTGLIYRRAPVANISLGGTGPLEAEGKGGGRRGCDLEGGVRGMSGAITMERSEDEKLKFPDRINLDRKGLHGEGTFLFVFFLAPVVLNRK